MGYFPYQAGRMMIAEEDKPVDCLSQQLVSKTHSRSANAYRASDRAVEINLAHEVNKNRVGYGDSTSVFELWVVIFKDIQSRLQEHVSRVGSPEVQWVWNAIILSQIARRNGILAAREVEGN